MRNSLLLAPLLVVGARPALAADPPELALAKAIHQAAGGEALDKVALIRFHFVVTDGDKRLVDAEHRWDRRGDRDRVIWKGKDGKQRDATVDLRSRTAVGTIDGAAAEGEALKELGTQAYQRWTNDSYWLMMPLKLLDPGVNLALEADRVVDGGPHQVLKLTFGKVGLTPGDSYWLVVDPKTHRVVRWEMLLEGDKPPAKGASWEDYRPVGPLTLSHTHVFDPAPGRKLLFEGTAASDKVDEALFAR